MNASVITDVKINSKYTGTAGLLLSTALVSIATGILIPSAALAADECGLSQEGVVNCSPEDNPYPNGIEYISQPIDPAQDPTLDPAVPVYDLTVNLESGVSVERDNGAGVTLTGLNDGAVTLNSAENTGIAVTGNGAVGVAATTDVGDLTINTQSITADGDNGAGIEVVSNSGDIAINAGDVAVTGYDSAGIAATTLGGGDISIVSTGTVSTAGDFSNGVIGSASAGGDVNIEVNNVYTDGFLSPAVYGIGDSVDVTVNGTVTTSGFASVAVTARALNGTATVVNNGTIETNVGGGGGIVAYGSEGASVISTGTVITHGPSATGIAANGYDGTTTISANSVVVEGDYSRGVTASGSGDVIIELGDVSTSGRIGTAIEAATFQNGTGPLDADLIIEVDNVTATGDYSSGISAFSSNNGIISIDAGTINVTGANGIGITSQSFTADTLINVDTLTTTGAGDAYSSPIGIQATSASGAISITSSNLVSTQADGAFGIYAYTGGDVSIDVNDVATQGDNAPAVVAIGANADVTINGDVSTTGTNSLGVYALGQTGDASVANNGTVSTQGQGSGGIVAAAFGDVTVSGSGSVSSAGTGVDVYSLAGNIAIGQAAIETTGDGADGIHAESGNYYGDAGKITIDTGTVSTTGDRADGIEAQAGYGGAIDIAHGEVSTSGDESFGVVAVSFDNVSISGGSVTTTGYNAAGVYGVSILGDTSATNTGTVSTVGDYAPGVVAASYFGNAVVNANEVSTQGYSSDATFAIGFYGDASATVHSVSTAGENSVGVRVEAYYDGSAAVLGSASTSGDYSDAVRVTTIYGAASVVNSGTISTTGLEANGISANGGDGGIVISGTGTVATSGDFSTGILARTTYGSAAVASGAITTSGYGASGINAYGSIGASVDAASVTTTGDQSTAIFAGGNYSVSVSAGAIRTSGANSDGIDAVSFGGDVTIDVGSVRTTGSDTVAISAAGRGGGADVSVAGEVRSEGGVGISMLASGVGGSGNIGLGDPELDGISRLSVTSGGSATGQTDAVRIQSLNGTQVSNAGVITGGSGYALRILGGGAAIGNSGTIAGQLSLTQEDDALNNSGTLLLTGESDFGAGADSLTNSGTIGLTQSAATRPLSIGLSRALETNVTTAQTVSVIGLERLDNSGTIELRNGFAGDLLSFAGTAYAGSDDASLGLDVAFANGTVTTDQLVVGSATGSTSVLLAISGTPTLIAPTTIVQTDAGSDPAAFVIAPGSSDYGLISFGVISNDDNTAYQLVTAPSAAVYRQAQLGEALTTLWNRSADAVSAQLGAGRDAAWITGSSADSGRFWLQALGEANTRKDRRSFSYQGLVQNDVDLGYQQDAFGAQAGFDLVGGGEGSAFIAGVTAGYLNSTTRFSAGGGDRFEVDAGNIGLYAGFRGGPFFVNGLAKYDFYDVERRSYFAALEGADNASGWGGKVETGFRFGSSAFFAEPVVSLAYSHISLDDFNIDSNAFDYDRFTGLRGKAGLRVGGSADFGGSTVAYYIGGAAVKEFEGKDGLRFTSAGQTVDLVGDRLGTYGLGTIGVNIATVNGVSGFIEGHGEFGDEYRGGGGRAGLRIAF